MSAATSTSVAAGRMSPNASPWTAVTSEARVMSVTNIRVRTTMLAGLLLAIAADPEVLAWREGRPAE